MRIGLISDTHIPEAPELWPQAVECFAGCDAILHAGDIYDLAVLDRLAEVAPLYACRGNGDDGSGHRPRKPDHPCLADHQLLELAGLTVAITHWVPVPETPGIQNLAAALTRFYGEGVRPDVVIHGDTHVEDVRTVDGILCVNPGSPTFPHNLSYQFGTVGFLEISGGAASAEILRVSDHGLEPFDWQRWGRRPW
jgi:hypothetical protein